MCWSRSDRSYGTGSYDDRHSPVEDAPPASDFRVSDRERQDVIDQLRRHTGEGRLTLDEFESRLDEVLQARTGSDLQRTLRELPPPAPRRPSAYHRGSRPTLPRIPLPLMILGIVLVLSLAGGHPVFWLIIPVVFFCQPGRWRHHARPRVDQRDDVLTSA